MEATTPLDPCPACAAPLPPEARFCPGCGRPVGEAAAAPEPHPAREAPVTVQAAEPQYFGLGAPVFVFTVAAVLLVLAVVLLVTGNLLPGLLLLVAAFLLLPAFLAGARRWPESRIAQLSVRAADRARDEATVAAEAVSTWSRAGREVVRLRHEQFRLRRARDEKLRELGRSVLEADGETPALAAEARTLDERLRTTESTLEETLAGARRQVRSERAAIVATEVIRPDEVAEGGEAAAGDPDEADGFDADGTAPVGTDGDEPAGAAEAPAAEPERPPAQ